MGQGDDIDFYNPENHPWQVGQGSPADEQHRTDGYDDQWSLIAEHIAAGGSVETAPRPSLRKYLDPFLRPTLVGIQQARTDAAGLIDAGLYDVDSILADIANANAEEEARDAGIDAGHFTLPDLLESARLHTTITNLFTDRFVYDVVGEEFTPTVIASKCLTLRGRLHLCGQRDIDTGIDLDGDYQVDLVEAGSGLPGPGDPVMRLLWGPESSILGAIHCGRVTDFGKSGGFGPAGASRDFRQAFSEAPNRGEIALINTASGTSAWCMTGGYGGPFDVFLLVDRDRKPVGIVLDDSGITTYSWYEELDGEPEAQTSPWPEDAREFNILTDKRGFNPNVSQQCEAPTFFF